MIKDLLDIEWMRIGKTNRYSSLKKDIAHVCRDVTQAACIDEICIHDIVKTFHNHGYSIIKTHKKIKSIVK